jgi:hypothetical protein
MSNTDFGWIRRDFTMIGLKDAIGKRPDNWVTDNANKYLDVGVLMQQDVVELHSLIVAKNTPVVVENVVDDAPIIEEPTV